MVDFDRVAYFVAGILRTAAEEAVGVVLSSSVGCIADYKVAAGNSEDTGGEW